MNIQILFGQAISQNSLEPLIAKGYYLLRMSNDCCLHRAVQGQLSECKRRNTATVLRAAVKSYNCLRGTKYLAVGILEVISTNSQNLQEKIRAGVLLL